MTTGTRTPLQPRHGTSGLCLLVAALLAALVTMSVQPGISGAAKFEKLIDQTYGIRGFAPVPRLLGADYVTSATDESGTIFLLGVRDGVGGTRIAKIKPSGDADARFGTVELSKSWKIVSIYSHVGGGVLVANFDSGSPDAGRVVVRRYTRDGMLDRKFGRDGRVVANRTAKYDMHVRMSVLADGSFVVGSRVPGTTVAFGSPESELRSFSRRGIPRWKFGRNGILRMSGQAGEVVGRPGVPGGLIVSSIDRLPSTDQSELATYSPVVELRALRLDGRLDAEWGDSGSLKWAFAPSEIVAKGLRDCACSPRNFRFSLPQLATTSRGSLLITHEMTDPSDDSNVPESLYWRSWVSAGQHSSTREATYLGISNGLGEGDPGEEVFHSLATLGNGRAVLADSYADCYDLPCDHDINLISATPSAQKTKRACTSYERKERGWFGFVGASRTGVLLYAAKGRRDAIVRIPYSRISSSCG